MEDVEGELKCKVSSIFTGDVQTESRKRLVNYFSVVELPFYPLNVTYNTWK